jgi:hypothetical protein
MHRSFRTYIGSHCSCHVSRYMGQALAEDRGYKSAFMILMIMAMVAALLYFFCMPETLPEHSKSRNGGIETIASIREEDEDDVNTSGASEIAPPKAGANYIEMA